MSCFYSWPGRVQLWCLRETYKHVSGWWSTHDAAGLWNMSLWKICVISRAGQCPLSSISHHFSSECKGSQRIGSSYRLLFTHVEAETGDLKAMPQWACQHEDWLFLPLPVSVTPFHTGHVLTLGQDSTSAVHCIFLLIILFNLYKMSEVFACLIILIGPRPLSLSPIFSVNPSCLPQLRLEKVSEG